MNKKIILSVVALIVMIGAILYWLNPQTLISSSKSTPNLDHGQSTPDQTKLVQQTGFESNATLKKQFSQAKLRRPYVGLDETQFNQQRLHNRLVQEADLKDIQHHSPMLLKGYKPDDGRIFIHFDPYSIESKFEGDSVKIYVPELGLNQEGIINKVESIEGDDIVRWTGVFANNQGDFSVSQTLKDQYTIMTVNTAQGSYVMESKNGYGWVKAQSTDDFHEHDAVELPH